MWTTLPSPIYSKSEVSKLGSILAQKITYEDIHTNDDIIQAFAAFNNWRASHAYPLRRASKEAERFIKRCGFDYDVSVRLKRIDTVRRKLIPRDRDHAIKLGSIYDLGGLRIITDNLEHTRALCEIYMRGESIFEVDKNGRGKDYISNPQSQGYRSHHFVLKFDGSGKDRISHKGQRVELQIRTRRQHIWATASEGMSFLEGCSFKHGEGDPRWHELFRLMSDVFADRDGIPVDDISDTMDRIRPLAKELKAISRLRSARNLATLGHGVYNEGWLVLDYQNSLNDEERIQKFDNYDEALKRYEAMERANPETNAVLLAINPGFQLSAAYPNYFMDMTAFANTLEAVLAGREYSMPLKNVREITREASKHNSFVSLKRRKT